MRVVRVGKRLPSPICDTRRNELETRTAAKHDAERCVPPHPKRTRQLIELAGFFLPLSPTAFLRRVYFCAGRA
jgi:hypothetical protein